MESDPNAFTPFSNISMKEFKTSGREIYTCNTFDLARALHRGQAFWKQLLEKTSTCKQHIVFAEYAFFTFHNEELSDNNARATIAMSSMSIFSIVVQICCSKNLEMIDRSKLTKTNKRKLE